MITQQKLYISIHALARRATIRTIIIFFRLHISIHALARRATSTVTHCIAWQTISIHALARRATCRRQTHQGSTSDFNPRSRKESDCGCRIFIREQHRFQSTLSQGERRKWGFPAQRGASFQSTLSQGERHMIIVNCGGA